MEKRWEDVPNLLNEILGELKLLNSGNVKQETAETEQTEKPKQEVKEEKQDRQLTHEELKDFCLELNRQNPDNKEKIKSIISKFTDGKLMDVPSDKLPDLKAQIEAEL